MQITISAEQLRLIRDWAEPAVIPFLLWFYKRSVKAVNEKLNAVITDNTNRNRDELIDHIDQKFSDHEGSAFGRLAELERSNTALQQSVAELRRLIVKYQDEMQR
jgi:hypothetical protein